MKKILFFLILFFFLVGCNSKNLCETPFIESNGECCLDMDENGVCDTLKAKTEEPIGNQVTGQVVAPKVIVPKQEPKVIIAPTPIKQETPPAPVEVKTIEEIEETILNKEITAVSEFVDMFKGIDGYKFIHAYNKYFLKAYRMKIVLSNPLEIVSQSIDGQHYPIFYVDTVYLNRNDKTAKGYCEGVNDQFFKQCTSLEIRDIPMTLHYADYNIELPEDWLYEFESKEPVLVEKNKYYVLGAHTSRLTFEEDGVTTKMYMNMETGLPIRIEVQPEPYGPILVTDYPDLTTGNIRDVDVTHRSLEDIPPMEAFISTR